jgi:hypothetical protein
MAWHCNQLRIRLSLSLSLSLWKTNSSLGSQEINQGRTDQVHKNSQMDFVQLTLTLIQSTLSGTVTLIQTTL